MIRAKKDGTIPLLRDLPSGSRWSTADDGYSRSRKVVSEEVGIVARTFEKVHDIDDSYTYAIGSETAKSQLLIGASSNTFNGGGAENWPGTYLAAVGECLERYSAAWVPTEELRRCTYAQLLEENEKVAFTPDNFSPFSEQQYSMEGFEYVPFRKNTEMNWSRVQELSSGESYWAPSQLLYLYPTDPHDSASSIAYSTSTGLAFHSTPAEAILSGIYELVERDAFMITWYNQLSLPRIEIESDPVLARFMRRHIAPSGIEVHLINLTDFLGVPTVLGVSVNPHSSLATVALGASSGPTLRAAAQSAALESLQTRNWVKAEQRDGNALDPEALDLEKDIRSFEDHIRLYAGEHGREIASFLIQSDDTVRIDEVPVDFSGKNPNEEIANVVDHLAGEGVRLFAADMTSPDVLEARGAVFKVVSPDVQMLDVGYRRRYLGGPRLRTAAHSVGLASKTFEVDDLNPWPHPFP